MYNKMLCTLAGLGLLTTLSAFAQEAEVVPAISGADTSWLLISTALVLLMTLGLAFFYGELVRSKNASPTP